MFDERRQRVTGIDKSYPLQPITTRPMPNATSRPVKATTVMKFLIRFVLVGVAMLNHRYRNERTCRRRQVFSFSIAMTLSTTRNQIHFMRHFISFIRDSAKTKSKFFVCVHFRRRP